MAVPGYQLRVVYVLGAHVLAVRAGQEGTEAAGQRHALATLRSRVRFCFLPFAVSDVGCSPPMQCASRHRPPRLQRSRSSCVTRHAHPAPAPCRPSAGSCGTERHSSTTSTLRHTGPGTEEEGRQQQEGRQRHQEGQRQCQQQEEERWRRRQQRRRQQGARRRPQHQRPLRRLQGALQVTQRAPLGRAGRRQVVRGQVVGRQMCRT